MVNNLCFVLSVLPFFIMGSLSLLSSLLLLVSKTENFGSCASSFLPIFSDLIFQQLKVQLLLRFVFLSSIAVGFSVDLLLLYDHI